MARPIVPPIYQSVNFAFATTEAQRCAIDADPHRIYSRLSNPTLAHCEAHIAELEEAESALVFASGMGAISTLVFGLLRAGDAVLVDRRVYGGAATLFRELAPRFGIEVRWFEDASEIEAGLARRPAMLYFESPTNPLLRLVDIAEVARAARAQGVLSVIDGTLATPWAQRPLSLGVDLVVHSATKALNGHHDILAGVICGSQELIAKLQRARLIVGAILDPHAAFLLARGLETFELRVERCFANAAELARRLEPLADPAGPLERVIYPGLASHPDHALAQVQMRGFGAIVTVDLRSLAAARRFADALERFALAGSLGGNESLACLPPLTSHAGWSDEDLRSAGLSPGIVRLAIGLERPERLFEDIARALEVASAG